MAMLNPMKILMAILITSACLAILFPFFASSLPSNAANQLNETAYNETQTFNTSVYGSLSNTLLGKQTNGNYTGGLFANVDLFTGLAFVVNGFGFVILSLLNVPSMFIIYLSVGLAYSPVPINMQAILIKALLEVMLVGVFALALSMWMKFKMSEGG